MTGAVRAAWTQKTARKRRKRRKGLETLWGCPLQLQGVPMMTQTIAEPGGTARRVISVERRFSLKKGSIQATTWPTATTE